MKALIVDDEAPARSRLRGLVDQLPDWEVAGEAADGAEALRQAVSAAPDVVLLDIRMPGMDGLEAARHLAGLEHPPAVIFTTAFDHHALEAFEAAAVDYLLKPIRRERLEQALDRARRPNRAQLNELGGAARSARTHICASSRGSLQLVPIEEVFYFLADQKYVSVHHAGGELLIEESLKSLEEEFGERFLRVHRNALVAADQLVGIEKTTAGGQVARLRSTGDRVEISRRHTPALRRHIRRQG